MAANVRLTVVRLDNRYLVKDHAKVIVTGPEDCVAARTLFKPERCAKMKRAERLRITNMEREKGVAKAKKRWRTVATICASLGELFAANEMFAEALEQAEEEAEVVGVHLKDADWIWSIRCRMVDYLNKTGDFEEAAKRASENRSIATQSGNDTNEQDAEHLLGQVYMTWALSLDEAHSKEEKKRYVHRAFKSFDKAMSLCRNKNWSDVPYRIAAVLENIGVLNNHLKEYNKAIENFEKAIELAPDDRQLVGNSLGELVVAKRALGCDKAAESVCRQRVALFEGSGNKTDWLESMIMLAHVLLSQEKYDQAADVLRMTKPMLEERSVIGGKIARLLRQINSAHTLYRQIGNCKDSASLYRLYEKLGDLFSGQLSSGDIKQYRLAITYYGKMLDAASAAGISQTSAYVSLMETYRDMEFYRDAYSHALKIYELEKDNPEDQVSTALTLADLSDKADMTLDVSVGWYKSALERAKRINRKDLMATIYHDWVSMLQCRRCGTRKSEREAYELKSVERRWNELKEFYVEPAVPSSAPASENDEGTEEDEEDEVDMEASSKAAGEQQEKEDEPSDRRAATGRSKAILRKNAVGESRLHRAAIENRVKTVLRLLEEKHPIDAVDNAGWTPLHEAANRGHNAVVKALIDHGANLNPLGMQGLTPLMDAAANGHWEVMRLLLEANADVCLLDETGRSVLDYMNDWSESAESTVDSEPEYLLIRSTVEQRLKETTSSSTPCAHVAQPDHNDTMGLHRKRKIEGASSVGFDEGAEEFPSGGVTDFSKMDEAGYGRKLYVEALKSVGSRAASSKSRSFSSDNSSEKEEEAIPGPALVTEEEFEAAEVFFIDDAGRKKRRRPLSSVSRTSPATKKAAASLLSPALRLPSFSISSGAVISPSESRRDQSGLLPAACQTEEIDLTGTGMERALHADVSSTLASDCLAKVTIDGWTVAIPVSANDLAKKTVEWLINEAASRYAVRFWKDAEMTMFTSDNAELSSSDPLRVVLSSEKGCLRCKISHWEYIPLSRRLERICELDSLKVPASLAEAFRTADESDQLTFTYCELEEAVLRSVIKALEYSSLTVVDLSGTVFTLKSIYAFGVAVGRLNALEKLVLRHCSLSAGHLERFSKGLDAEGGRDHLQALRVLDFGDNPLGDGSVTPLLRILSRCPNLKKLTLDNAYITGALFVDQKEQWERLMEGVHLESLNLSKNSVGAAALKLLEATLKSVDVMVDQEPPSL